jgi:hypothetical protein
MIEKATAFVKLTDVAKKYGADLSVFRGRASVTRINDVVQNARTKNKPIALFYISDCDIAGWNMPKSAFKRINEIYPGNNILVKVALTREQIKKYNLPPAFDVNDKDYDNIQKEEFIRESGNNECVELDALREDIMIQLLEDEILKYAGLAEDDDEYEALKNIDINTSYIEHLKPKYENLRSIYNPLAEKINKFYADCGIKEFFKILNTEIQEYERVKSTIVGA